MLKTFIENHTEQMLDSIAKLIKIPSVMGNAEENAPFGKPCADALKAALEIAEGMGFSVKNFDNYVGTAEYIPEGAEGVGLAVLCHLDVVPSGSGWTYPPFECTRSGDIIIGRGVIDDKGPAMAALYALYAVKEQKIPLKKGIRIIFGTNEENGSADLEYYEKCEAYPEKVFTPDGSFPVINIEKGMLRSFFGGDVSENAEDFIISVKGGTVANAVPESAEAVIKPEFAEAARKAISEDKSGVEFTVTDSGSITAKGRSAHASTPESGINAIVGLMGLLCKISDGKSEKAKKLSEILKIFPMGETDGKSLGLKCSDEKSGALTSVFSIFEMSDGHLKGTLDVRFPTCLTLAEVKSAEEKAFSTFGCKIENSMGDEPHITDENSDFIRTLLSVYEKHTGGKGRCLAIGGGTYVHNIKGGVAFGAEFGDTDYHMHGADEFVPVKELVMQAAMYADAMAECGK